MKGKCKHKGGYHLTIGKIYDLEPIVNNLMFKWWVINDRGYKHKVEESLFILLRDININKLLNNEKKTN